MKKAPPIPACVKLKIRDRVYALAAEHRIPPVFITAHVRVSKAVEARKSLMLELLDDYGLAVQQVADIFGRDRRRCRPSVLRPSTETRPVKIMVPVVILPGNQFAWDFSHWIGQHAAPRAKKPFHPGQWIREIPEETVRALSEDERKALRKRLRMQLARL